MRDKPLWAFIAKGATVPPGRWFSGRFLEAAGKIVDRWGPRWAKYRIGGHAAGSWILALFWLAIATLGIVDLVR
jgi:hypothetical protein